MLFIAFGFAAVFLCALEQSANCRAASRAKSKKIPQEFLSEKKGTKPIILKGTHNYLLPCSIKPKACTNG